MTDDPRVHPADAQLAEVRRLQALYPDKRGALLPVLHLAQETFGYVSLEVEEYVAELFDLSPGPRARGRHVLHALSSRSRRGATWWRSATTCPATWPAPGTSATSRQRLGVEVGETTDDGRVTLLAVECLCACERAPMMQVDDRYELDLTPEKVDRILEGLR